jgi:hypothetical protein
LTGLAIIVAGWACVVAGLVLTVGTWTLIPLGAVTTAAGFFIDWEAARAEHR